MKLTGMASSNAQTVAEQLVSARACVSPLELQRQWPPMLAKGRQTHPLALPASGPVTIVGVAPSDAQNVAERLVSVRVGVSPLELQRLLPSVLARERQPRPLAAKLAFSDRGNDWH